MSFFKKNILLVDTDKANLPELIMYKEELEKEGYIVTVLKKNQLNDETIKKFDIIWNFMGIDTKKYLKNQFVIHDYRSASSRFLPKIRDKLKKRINVKPNLRIFLNELLRNYYDFDDEVPSIILDMGVDLKTFKKHKQKKEYKFCYVGDISKQREIDNFLSWYVTSEFKFEKLLLIGSYEKDIYKNYTKYKNIIFLGKINYKLVPEYLSKVEYALNLIPNKFPFNIQTSTKLLEYISLDLKIISNNNEYVSNLLKKHSDLKIFLFDSYKNINKENLEKFYFNNIDMKEYSWNIMINLKIKELEKALKEHKRNN